MILALVITAGLGEWLCLQREMQDIQLNFTGGGFVSLTCEQHRGGLRHGYEIVGSCKSSTAILRAGRGRGGSGSTVSLSEGPSPMTFSIEKTGSLSRA